MNADLFYNSAAGRALLRILQRSGCLKAAGLLLQTRVSGFLIGPYIRKYGIDMSDFQGMKYRSFGDFFARKKPDTNDRSGKENPETNSENVLISPCDGLVSVFDITSDMQIPMKGSVYAFSDIIPGRKAERYFAGGLCVVIRLEASDYHHFCYFDDCFRHETHYRRGQLHSVQPIALRSVPVYKLNRRWWTILDTKHFGKAAQVEVGAVLVGGVTHAHVSGVHRKGDEMGNFELRGSTILLMFSKQVSDSITFLPEIEQARSDGEEIRVHMGDPLGRRMHEE